MTQTARPAGRSAPDAQFTRLVAAYTDLVYGAALRRLRDAAAAEDATQAVFLVLLKKLPALSPSRPMGPWLLRVTQYVCKDSRKKTSRRRVHEGRAAVVDRYMPEPVDEASAEMVLDEALLQLPAHERDALTLRYLERMDVPAVAAAAGVPLETARKRITRGLARLRNYFSRHEIQLTAVGCGEFLEKAGGSRAPAHVAVRLASLSPKTASAAAAILAKSAGTAMAVNAVAWPAMSGFAIVLAGTVTTALVLAPPRTQTRAVAASRAPATQWVHVHYDAGQIQDEWTNLATGESYISRYDGNQMYLNDKENIRWGYWKESGVIDEDQPVRYAGSRTAAVETADAVGTVCRGV